MFQRWPGVVRLAAVAAAGSCCLAAAACGSSATDPLAGLSASKVVALADADADADAEAAPSLTVDGTVSESGTTLVLDLGIKPGHGCTETIGISGRETVKLVVMGNTTYFEADAAYWKAVAGSRAGVSAAEASAEIALIQGRYFSVPTSQKSVATLTSLCNVSKLLTANSASPGAYTKEAVTTLGGTGVVPIKASDGSTEYVTDTSKPEFVRADAPKGSAAGAASVTFKVGAPVTLTAPSGAINGAQLGL